MRCIQLGLVATVAVLLSACTSGMVAGFLTIQEDVMPSHRAVDPTLLKPEFRYLRVENKGQEALMVWVGNEPGPLGETSVWVSADGVILRLNQGRLVGVAERGRNWRLTSESVLANTAAYTGKSYFSQTSDEQPGFRLGIVRTIKKITWPSTPPAVTWAPGANDLQWIEEVDTASGHRLALYGVNADHHAQAGQRCLAPEWCLRWQIWPARTSTSPP